ncbi:hypothetical protein AVEN_203403-1 [Araneus ventricosus]|uniref:Uncharacterized protein n=1 Tax=Araneus ventricosus TaxID=182803 RepID=A0A4Y2I9V7_ARAVE|nr:hypothetical protein AVEN_203403-1 [Araneus ventricosus]
MENDGLFTNNSGNMNHRTISLIQFSNTNRQKSLAITVTAFPDLATQTDSDSLIMTVTALSVALNLPAFQLALQTKLQSAPSKAFALPKTFSVVQHVRS